MATLTTDQIASFVEDGFVRLDGAFPREVAASCRTIVWHRLGYTPDDPATWKEPVVRVLGFPQQPFKRAVNAPQLLSAFDQLVGEGYWRPRKDPGTFVVRFPCPGDPKDTGWHIDSSFMAEDSKSDDYSTWRVNLRSRGRALLMLFLFSDVGEQDAPTRIRVGSHLDVPSLLEPFGEDGVAPERFLAADLEAATARRSIEYAIGEAGTVYLCHPFLVHAAQRHRGSSPRVMSQPELPTGKPLQLCRKSGTYSPVEHAIRRGLGAS